MDWKVWSLCSYRQIDGSLKCEFLEKWVCIKETEREQEKCFDKCIKEDGFCVLCILTQCGGRTVFREDFVVGDHWCLKYRYIWWDGRLGVHAMKQQDEH